MTGRKSVVKVQIVGEEYSIRTEASPEHTLAVAEYVDRAIRAVMGSGGVIESHKAAILAALQIAAELFKERESTAEITDSMRDLSDDVRRWLPPAKRVAASGE